MEFGTSEARYVIEVDGVSAVRASEVTGVGLDHTPFKLYESNRGNPMLGRGNYECTEVKIKQGHALNEAGQEFFQWVADFVRGEDVERRFARLIVYDENGRTIHKIWEMHECIPMKMEEDNHKSGGSEPAYFNVSIKPTDLELI